MHTPPTPPNHLVYPPSAPLHSPRPSPTHPPPPHLPVVVVVVVPFAPQQTALAVIRDLRVGPNWAGGVEAAAAKQTPAATAAAAAAAAAASGPVASTGGTGCASGPVLLPALSSMAGGGNGGEAGGGKGKGTGAGKRGGAGGTNIVPFGSLSQGCAKKDGGGEVMHL